MNVRRMLPALLVILLFIGGTGQALANTDSTSKKDCKTVYDCTNQSGDQSDSKTSGTEESTPIQTESDSSTISTTVKVIFALIFVVGLMIVVLKLLHKRTQIVQQGKGIQTLGGAMLGNQRSVQMVKVGDRVLIVGVGDDVTLIKEIDDKDEARNLLTHYDTKNGSSQMGFNFLDWLKEKLTTSPKRTNSFQETLKKRLEEAKKGRTDMFDAIKKEQGND